jgi:hypothetical protein
MVTGCMAVLLGAWKASAAPAGSPKPFAAAAWRDQASVASSRKASGYSS